MSDREKIEGLFDSYDFPVYALCDILEYQNLNHLKASYWSKCYQGKCSFCQDNTVTRENKYLNLLACESCFTDIKSGEVDVVNPGDHLVSQVIHQILRDLIQKNYFLVASSDMVFEECEIKHNTCCVCQQTIWKPSGLNKSTEGFDLHHPLGDAKAPLRLNEDVALSTNYNEMAHYECVKDTGFLNTFTERDFKDIIEYHFSDLFEN